MRSHSRAALTIKAPLLLLVFLQVSDALALESLTDDALSSVSGQDGLTFDIQTSATGLAMESLEVELSPGVVNYEASLVMSASPDGSANGLPISLLNVNGSGIAGGAAHAIHTLDVGSSGSDAYLSYSLDIHGQPDGDGNQRARLVLGELSHGGAKAYGSSVLDGEGYIHLVNQGGPFNVDATDAYLLGELKNSRIYYRQLAGNDPNRSYLIMDNLNARWEMLSGTLGLDQDGIVMKTPDTIDVALDFDMFHKTGGDDFTPGGRGLMHFGWLGSLKDPELLWRTKGAAGGVNTPGVINLSSRWNFVGANDPIAIADPSKEFRWRLGETGGASEPANGDTRVQFELADWATWGGHPYGHDFPLIALDVISGNRLGDMSLCWGEPNGGACGGESVNLTPGYLGATGGNEGIAIYTRDGSFQTYSRKINVIEETWNSTTNQYDMLLLDSGAPYYSPTVSRTVDWGLVYTLANIDGNILLHPGGNPDNTDKGITADITLISQTFDELDPTKQGFNWDEGTHLLLADTNMDGDAITGETRDAMGIGLMSTSFLFMADDARIWVKPQSDANDYNSGGIDIFSPRTRFAINTTFGGGVLPDNNGQYGMGSRFVKGSIITANLEGAVNFRLSPSDPNPGPNDGQNYLGFSGAIRLTPRNNDAGATGFGASPYGSHLSLAEPSNPDIAFRLANMSGDIAMTDGKVDVRPGEEDSDNKPKMVISQNMLLGRAAASRMAEVSGMPTTASPDFRIDSLMLGDATLGRVVMPSARIYSSFTLQPQN